MAWNAFKGWRAWNFGDDHEDRDERRNIREPPEENHQEKQL